MHRYILMVMADLAHCYENNSITRKGQKTCTQNINFCIYEELLNTSMLVDHNNTTATLAFWHKNRSSAQWIEKGPEVSYFIEPSQLI